MLLHLDGWTVEEMAIEPSIAMVISWPAIQTRRFDFTTFSVKETAFNEAKENAEKKQDELRDWLEAARRGSSVLPKSPVGVAVRYVLPRWEAFTRYCSDGQLAIDNNLAERALRPCAIGRKNWTFLGSDRGGRTAAILYSFTATAKAIHLDPHAYLRHLFAELPATPPSADLEPYLPHHHLAAHPESNRPTSR